MLTEILGCLEEIQKCLEVADSDERACRRGIITANDALKLTSDDPDVKCDIRMKRAQLLYMAVSIQESSWIFNMYNREGRGANNIDMKSRAHVHMHVRAVLQ